MKLSGYKLAIGIMTDENAMFDLLSKFLVKEGYDIKRLDENTIDVEGCPLVVFAPTREFSRSKVWFENLKRKNPKVLVVQCCEEDTVSTDDKVVVLQDRPLNLKQLSATIVRTLKIVPGPAMQTV
ncbi:MAG: hypothetical protein M1339_04700 [Bacteroidetes bacterium]|nr:hypothetical protein [Bacteroidota bacterium]